MRIDQKTRRTQRKRFFPKTANGTLQCGKKVICHRLPGRIEFDWLAITYIVVNHNNIDKGCLDHGIKSNATTAVQIVCGILLSDNIPLLVIKFQENAVVALAFFPSFVMPFEFKHSNRHRIFDIVREWVN